MNTENESDASQPPEFPTILFEPETPPTKADDAISALQDIIESHKAESRKERFVCIFVMIILFDGFVGQLASTSVFVFFIVASLILSIALARWLEFPWIVTDLEVWLARVGRWLDNRFGKNEPDKTEPM